jgi:hypothetical protein
MVHISELTAAVIRRQRLMQQLHECGPRPIFEILSDLEPHYPGLCFDFNEAAARYVNISPAVYRALGADQFPQPTLRGI